MWLMLVGSNYAPLSEYAVHFEKAREREKMRDDPLRHVQNGRSTLAGQKVHSHHRHFYYAQASSFSLFFSFFGVGPCISHARWACTMHDGGGWLAAAGPAHRWPTAYPGHFLGQPTPPPTRTHACTHTHTHTNNHAHTHATEILMIFSLNFVVFFFSFSSYYSFIFLILSYIYSPLYSCSHSLTYSLTQKNPYRS